MAGGGNLRPEIGALGYVVGITVGTFTLGHRGIGIWVEAKDRCEPIGQEFGDAAGDFRARGLRATKLFAALVVARGLRATTKQVAFNIEF